MSLLSACKTFNIVLSDDIHVFYLYRHIELNDTVVSQCFVLAYLSNLNLSKWLDCFTMHQCSIGHTTPKTLLKVKVSGEGGSYEKHFDMNEPFVSFYSPFTTVAHFPVAILSDSHAVALF